MAAGALYTWHHGCVPRVQPVDAMMDTGQDGAERGGAPLEIQFKTGPNILRWAEDTHDSTALKKAQKRLRTQPVDKENITNLVNCVYLGFDKNPKSRQ